MWLKAAHMGPQLQAARMRLVHQVKSHPVVARHGAMQLLDDRVHQRIHCARGLRYISEVFKQFLMLGHFSGTGWGGHISTRAAFIYSAAAANNVIVGYCAGTKQQPSLQADTDFSLAFLLHVPAHQLRHLFRKGLLRFSKRVGEIAFNINLSHQLIFSQDWDYQVRLHNF